ncbi:hypothetical protein [Leptolyngbya sp. BC1307]|uniref:hypothetical protein n=1 Tax=Leptolyngbya sp. BC1307 TaxID=2029589 RepID=UPI000EFA844D|nr:hypothetical protein [Leptolyngbya sp. BC1307]
MPTSSDSLIVNIGLFAIAVFVIGVVGVKMTKVADRLADKTGLGEAVMGALFLGGTTSLPGVVTSVTAAATGHPELSISKSALSRPGIVSKALFRPAPGARCPGSLRASGSDISAIPKRMLGRPQPSSR